MVDAPGTPPRTRPGVVTVSSWLLILVAVIQVLSLIVTLSTSYLLAFGGFLVMLGCALYFERNLRKLGKAGLEQVTRSIKATGFRDAIGGFFGYILNSLGQDFGWPVPEGGAGRLADALANRLRAKGGRIECNARVDKVLVHDGRAVAVRSRGVDIRAEKAILANVYLLDELSRLPAQG